ncbi:hypothetical protein DV738_g5451, partial [Chaetothyriales sp. CBS 135597]
MSLFGAAGGTPASSGASSGSLFSGLTVNTGSASTEKRKSIFDPSTSQRSISSPSIFTTGAAPAASSSAAAPSFAAFSFGKPASSSSAAVGSIAPTAPAPSTNIFGSAATSNTTSAAPSASLFGGSALAGSTTGSAFGSLAPSTTANPFTSTTTAAPQTQLPGNAAAVSDRTPRDGGYFSSLLERQKKKAKLEAAGQPNTIRQLPTLSIDLGDLARKAREFGQKEAGADSKVIDSRAHYLLAGSGVKPGNASRHLHSLDADSVLAESRPPFEPLVDTDEYIKNLTTKGRDAVVRESMDRVYREVDSYIEQTLGIDFDEQKTRIMKHLGLIPDNDGDDVAASQSASRLGRSPSKDGGFSGVRSAFGRSGLNKSIIGTPGSTFGSTSFGKPESTAGPAKVLLRGQTARDLRDKERLFIEQVQALNQARLRHTKYQILDQFAKVEANARGDSPHQLKDAYDALRFIVGETDAASAPKERQFAQLYLDGSSNNKIELRRRIIDGSRRYLEQSFYREIESIVDKNPREAQLGGRPTPINKIRAYIRVRASRRDLAPDGTELQQIGDNGDFCWILIFYLLRCGFVKEAADYVINDAAFQSTDRRFVSYLSAYAASPDRLLSRKLHDMIEGEYQQRAKLAPKGTVDPYRMACYKLVGRCDLQSKSLDVGTGIEDWIWLQFSLAREGTDDPDQAGLHEIQALVTEIGDKHFQRGQPDAGANYGVFFLLQILAGMFEQAVDFLYPLNPVSAVHFAIALTFYGLLRLVDYNVAGSKLLDVTTTNEFAINFVPLIAHYTGSFRTALPVAAVDYLALICLNSDLQPPGLGQTQTRTCHESLRELCLETREFAKLLGDSRIDGSRIPGAIEQRARIVRINNHDEFLKTITTQAAAIADQRGQVSDAVLLYHLSDDYDNVVSVLNRSLADAVSLDLGESPLELEPLKPLQPVQDNTSNNTTGSLSLTQSTSSPVELAKRMITLYNDNAAYYNAISATNRETCGALLRMLQARAHLEANPPRYMTALEELNDLGILPLSANGNIPSIRAAATAFGSLPQLLARCAGLSVVWAVGAIGGEREKIIRHGSWETGYGGDRDALKEQLGSMAKDLMVFAGLVKYKLPARVYDLLTRAGADVGGY